MAISKTVIVTEASRALGSAVAERLARDDFMVIVNCVGNRVKADSLVRSIEGFGGMAHAIRTDICDADAVRQMFDAAEREFGGVDVLINNSGEAQISSIAETDDMSFDRQIDVNFRGAFIAMREAAKRIRQGGRIINLSSSVVQRFPINHAIYAATKAAVEMMTRVLAKELVGRQITVNAVASGIGAADDNRTSGIIKRLAAGGALGPLDGPDEVAAVIAFLAGPDSSWINGQVIRANVSIE